MTVTSLGIMLIVNGVLFWAIMTALHRHTVALKGLRLQIEALAVNQRADTVGDVEADGNLPAGHHRSGETLPPKHRAGRADSSIR
jgi:hypothetical protein